VAAANDMFDSRAMKRAIVFIFNTTKGLHIPIATRTSITKNVAGDKTDKETRNPVGGFIKTEEGVAELQVVGM